MTKIYISPSSQQGNVGPAGYVEEKYMNLVADLLIPELNRHGIETMRNKTANTFRDHVRESNAYKPDYHIAIHSNASAAISSHRARGCIMFCLRPDNDDAKGTQLAKAVYARIEQLTPVRDRGIHATRMDEVEKTTAPAILVEIDFHDNYDGAMWLMNNIPEISKAILLGVLEQCGIDYKPQEADQAKYLYRVQAGAFYNKDYAEDLRARLLKAGFNAIIVKSGG
jgi:N-acetylmuramoyl-L-alanine amidase